MAVMLSWLYVACCIMSSFHIGSFKSINWHDTGKITSLVEEVESDLNTLVEDYENDDSKFPDVSEIAEREGLTDDIMWEDDGNGKRTLKKGVRKWPRVGDRHPIPYTLHEDFTKPVKERIKDAIDYFNGAVNSCGAQFIPRTDEKHYVEFFPGKGCWSFLGKIKKIPQPISIGKGCAGKGIVVHEMMHAIGFSHEHSRKDRDKHIRINYDNIYKRRKGNFRIIARQRDLTEKTDYDYGSVMHYGRKAFSKNGENTIDVIEEGKKYVRLGNRKGLSPLDIEDINNFYCGKVKLVNNQIYGIDESVTRNYLISCPID